MESSHVGAEVFRSQRLPVERVRGILARTPIAAELESADLTFMPALRQRHPSAERKIDPGVRAIVSRRPRRACTSSTDSSGRST